jgi:hypothetical protein
MIEFDVDNMSNEQLATCVDEFVKRAMTQLASNGYDGVHAIQITASRYGPDAEFQIAHNAIIGSEYGGGITRRTNNLIVSARRANAAWCEDQNDKPVNVVPMITYVETVDA